MNTAAQPAPATRRIARRPPDTPTLLLALLFVCPGPSQATRADVVSAPDETAPGRSTAWDMLRPAGYRLDSAFEGLWAEDIRLWELNSTAGLRQSLWELKAQLGYASLGVDYQNAPIPDPFGHAEALDEDRTSGQFSLRVTPRRSELTWLASGGLYQGYTDYRSLWLNEYYRQRFQDFHGYETAHPAGWNASTGARWEYQPGTGFLQLDGVFQQDRVAPAYEKFPFRPLVRRRDLLDTWALRVGAENVWNRRLRSLNECQVLTTTDREIRYAGRTSLNYALAENWVLHGTASASYEEPRYYTWSAGTTLEYDLDATWFLALFGRYYGDNGQPNQSLPETTASPSLATLQAGATVRWQGESWAFKIGAGPYWSDYQAIRSELSPVINLYRDRTWVSVDAALSFAF